MMDRGNLRKVIPKKGQNRKLSSWEVTQQEFVNKVKDQVRSRQNRMSNVADSGEEHSISWEMFMAATMNAGDIHGKEFLNYSKFHHEFQRSHFKAKCSTSAAKLVGEQEEINNLDKIHWRKNFMETTVIDW